MTEDPKPLLKAIAQRGYTLAAFRTDKRREVFQRAHVNLLSELGGVFEPIHYRWVFDNGSTVDMRVIDDWRGIDDLRGLRFDHIVSYDVGPEMEVALEVYRK